MKEKKYRLIWAHSLQSRSHKSNFYREAKIDFFILTVENPERDPLEKKQNKAKQNKEKKTEHP